MWRGSGDSEGRHGKHSHLAHPSFASRNSATVAASSDGRQPSLHGSPGRAVRGEASCSVRWKSAARRRLGQRSQRSIRQWAFGAPVGVARVHRLQVPRLSRPDPARRRKWRHRRRRTSGTHARAAHAMGPGALAERVRSRVSRSRPRGLALQVPAVALPRNVRGRWPQPDDRTVTSAETTGGRRRPNSSSALASP